MRKLLAILVSFAVVFAMIPTMAFAATALTDDSVKVTITKDSFEYSGNAVDLGLKVTVTVDGTVSEIQPESNYTVTYSKKDAEGNYTTLTAAPSDVGEYKVTVRGDGENYTGTIDKTFKITPKNGSLFYVSIPAQKIAIDESSPYTVSGVVVKDGSTILNQSDDYDVVFTDKPVLGSNNNVTINFKNNYTGSRTATFDGKYDFNKYFDIVPKNTSTVEYVYAKGVKRTTTFDFVKKTNVTTAPAISASDYKVEYSDNENWTGSNISATFTPTENGNYTGTPIVVEDTKMLITKKSITASGISISVENSSDKAVPPSVTIKDGSYELVKDKDYLVEWMKDYTIKITGQGNYKDSVEKTFKVGKSITRVDIASSLFTYNGASQKPSISVVAGDVTVPSTGYRVEWPADTTNVGTKTFKVIGIGEYSGTIERTYTISAKDASKLDFSLSGTSFKYTGQYIKPTVTVRDGSKILTEGATKDYTLSYSSNVSYTPGVATVKVSLTGNYVGSKTLTYYIGKNPMTDLTITLDKDSYNYTGSAILPKVTVKKGTTAVSTANYTVEYSNNKAVGTGTVTIIGKNEYYGTVTKTFAITGKSIANCTVTVSPTSYAADGTAKEPAVTVKDGLTTLVKGTDYTVTYANNKTAGQASVTITGKGAYGGTKTEYFTITGKYQYVEVEQDAYTKYPTSSPFKLAPICNGDGTGFTFTSSDSSVASVAADGTVTLKAPGKAVITIATKGDVKYTPASETVTITVKPNKGSLAKLGTPAKKSLRVYINKRTGVDGYQIRYTRGTGYKYLTTKHVTSVYKTQYRTIKNLKSGYTYKVQVRAYKVLDDGTKLYGSWSTAKSIKVK